MPFSNPARALRMAAAVIAALGLIGTGAPVASAASEGTVVLIGTGGVRWDDVASDTPALYSLAESGSIGWLAVRSVRSTACPLDGWLAVSAGRRAAGPELPDDAARCIGPSVQPTGSAGGAARVEGWQSYRQAADDESFDADPGLLGETLAAAGTSSAAVGPGAAVALARRDGTVARFWGGSVPRSEIPGFDTDALADDVEAALATRPRLLVVDIGTVLDPAQRDRTGPRPIGVYAAPRAEQVAAIDTRLGLVLSQVRADPGNTVIVASTADSGTRARLQLLAALGPAPDGDDYAGLVDARSTRQPGLAQTTDLQPTLLAALGVEEPVQAVGSPLTSTDRDRPVRERLQKLDDLDAASTQVTPIVPLFFNGWVIAQLVLYGAATAVLRRRSGDDPAAALVRRRTLRWLRRGATVFACVPAATYLANLLPWWRAGSPGLAVTGAVLLFVLPMALVALLGPWRKALLGPFGAVGGMTMLVLAADALTGSRLTLSSLMGTQPVVAGRFYGFGNVAFALFATGSLMLAVACADALVRAGRRRAAVAAVLGIGLVALVIDGTPGLGSDFGGPPAIIPAFSVLALLVAGVRITVRRALLIGGVTLAVLVLLCVGDWLRPPADRTHLGRFTQTVIDGGVWNVVERKLGQNLKILVSSWLSALLPFAVAFVTLVLARPVAWGARPLALAYERSPVLRHGMAAFGVLLLIGFAVNDSGTAVPAVAATLALPLLIAASVRALELAAVPGTSGRAAVAQGPSTS